MSTCIGMYSIHDSNSGYWNLPFYCSSHLEARHRLRQMLLEQNLPADKLVGMSLEYIGYFDYADGKIYRLNSEGGSELVAILSDLLSDKEVE